LQRSRLYAEEYAVADTVAEVVNLRREGSKVVGLINGETKDGKGATKKIFANDFVLVHNIEKMTTQVGALLCQQVTNL